MKAVFWISVLATLYTYLIYPILLFFMAALAQAARDLRFLLRRSERRPTHKAYMPSVSMIIAAYNEEQVIEQKLHNCLTIDYPRNKFEIVVASDGSTDRTDRLVKQYSTIGVKLMAYSPRTGKISVINRTVPLAAGEVIVLSDANTSYCADSIRNLVRHFADPQVGVVCGELKLINNEGEDAEDLYWRYEQALKFLENRINAVLGANGGIYAIRKSCFEPVPDNTITDDFVLPLKIRERGFRIVYDTEAVAFEDAAPSAASEFTRRVRIGAGNFQSLLQVWRLLNPLRGSIAFALWSHKLLRWCVPFFMITALFSNALLIGERVYLFLFILQASVYAAVLVHSLAGDLRSWPFRPLRLFHYFCSMNCAFLFGFFKLLMGTQRVTWKRTERQKVA